MTFDVQVCRSLTHVSDAELDRTSAGASVFFDRRWFRLLDGLELGALIGGELEPGYVTVRRDGELVAVCPFLVTRSRTVYPFYSLEKYFFSAWWRDEALRLAPERARAVRWIARFMRAYKTVARAAGTGVQGWVLAVSPLSHRGDIALAPLAPDDRSAAIDAVLRALQGIASEKGLPLCFFGVPEERPLFHDLRERGLEPVFLSYDNVLELGDDASFDDWLGRFKSDARRLFRREVDQARSHGVRFERTTSLASLGEPLARLYDATSSKHGDDYVRQPGSYWEALERSGTGAEAVVAWAGDEPVGFSLLLSKGDELWFHRVGRSYDDALAPAPVYFNLAFYEPVKRALELGARRVWLGFGAWEAKRRRGAVGCPIASLFWFPTGRSRAVLLPYLRAFGDRARRELARATEPTAYLKKGPTTPVARPVVVSRTRAASS
jgi:hypothetical protein